MSHTVTERYILPRFLAIGARNIFFPLPYSQRIFLEKIISFQNHLNPLNRIFMAFVGICIFRLTTNGITASNIQLSQLQNGLASNFKLLVLFRESAIWLIGNIGVLEKHSNLAHRRAVHLCLFFRYFPIFV